MYLSGAEKGRVTSSGALTINIIVIIISIIIVIIIITEHVNCFCDYHYKLKTGSKLFFGLAAI